MGCVGGGGNIAIATTLPQSSSVYCVVNIKKFMDFLYLIFYGCLRLRFLDVETNPGRRRAVPDVCRIICSNVWGLAANLSDLTVWLRLVSIRLKSFSMFKSKVRNFYLEKFRKY